MTSVRRIAALAAAGFALPALAEAAIVAKVSRMEVVMGTLLQIEAEGSNAGALEAAVGAAFEAARRLDGLLSNYRPDSELSRINAEAAERPVQVSDEMMDFLQVSERMQRATRGYFDPAVEPLTRLWRLRERRLESLPTEREVAEAAALSGFALVKISTKDGTVNFAKRGAGIDSGGIGKGYALDLCLEALRSAQGAERATLNFGGEILYWSRVREARTFSVKDPLRPGQIWGAFEADMRMAAFALSTSGNYERFVESAPGRRIGHLLNPKTGRPADSEIRSVSVIAPSGSEADALSTALFCMGLQQAMEFSQTLEGAAAFILYERGGALRSFGSKEWTRRVRSRT